MGYGKEKKVNPLVIGASVDLIAAKPPGFCSGGPEIVG
jgi:hypothetical protein